MLTGWIFACTQNGTGLYWGGYKCNALLLYVSVATLEWRRTFKQF